MGWPSRNVQAARSQSKLQGEIETVMSWEKVPRSSQPAGVDTALPGGRGMDEKTSLQVALLP